MSLQDRNQYRDIHANAAALPNSGAGIQLPEPRKSPAHTFLATAQEPMAVLDRSLHVLTASRAFHRLFPATFAALPGRPFCAPAPLIWSAFARKTLQEVTDGNRIADGIEIELDVPPFGPRRMLLNARRLSDPDNTDAALLLTLQDVTELRDRERLKIELAAQATVLLQEAHHRIANSLQIIASILLLKARSVTSEETRAHLRDVHKRLILVAAVQRQLCTDGMLEEIEFGPYVAQLCAGLASSMTDGEYRVAILTSSSGGKIKSDDAVSFGLIVTELVINALKHGYPDGGRGCIAVDFAASGRDWRLSVSDDGVGVPQDAAPRHAGLGTNIVSALARHLKARVEIGAPAIGSATIIIHESGDDAAPRDAA